MPSHYPDNAFASIRREYGVRTLLEDNIFSDPIEQFNQWFNEIIANEVEPTAMTLATVDDAGMPNARIVLLKEIDQGQFVFYTHYDSAKGQEIAHHSMVALNFFWSNYIRQVRIRGTVQKVSETMSDTYFASRPVLSQLSALASHQSQVIQNREILTTRMVKLTAQYADVTHIPRPKQWGGYAVLPLEMEFWQGRDNRLHDRMLYKRNNISQNWTIERLSP